MAWSHLYVIDVVNQIETEISIVVASSGGGENRELGTEFGVSVMQDEKGSTDLLSKNAQIFNILYGTLKILLTG